jgi:hypothetical protein
LPRFFLHFLQAAVGWLLKTAVQYVKTKDAHSVTDEVIATQPGCHEKPLPVSA